MLSKELIVYQLTPRFKVVKESTGVTFYFNKADSSSVYRYCLYKWEVEKLIEVLTHFTKEDTC